MPRFDGRFFPSSQVADWASGKFGTPGWYPAAPTGVTPTEGDQEVALTWTEGNTHGADITGYKVEKNDGSWSTATSDTGSGTASYTVTGLTNGTAYTFRVTAINSVGLGETVSSVSAAKTPRGVPGTPGTLSLAAGDPSPNVIDLSWSAPGSINGGAITGYKIQRSTDGSSWSNLVADTGSTGTTYSNTGLTASTAYHYRVAAINAAGAGGYGNEPTLTTSAPFVGWSYSGSYTTGTNGSNTWVRCTSTGNFVITSNPNSRTFTLCLVAGGGGASGGNENGTGAGGGGGFRELTSQSLSTASHTVTIGGGGNGASGFSSGSTGTDSSVGSTSATGGGYGSNATGGDGGSGGGGGPNGNKLGGAGNDGSYSPVEGYNGGNGITGGWPIHRGGGGGGGAGAAGGQANYVPHGGIGETTSLTGTTYLVAGGGGSSMMDVGGGYSYGKGGGTDGNGTGTNQTLANADNQRYGAGNSTQPASMRGGNGGTNTGGGGGATAQSGASTRVGGAGGSGVVEIQWVT